MATLPRPSARVIDPADAYWVDIALHGSSSEPINFKIFEKYPWLRGIICVCKYCRAARIEDVTPSPQRK